MISKFSVWIPKFCIKWIKDDVILATNIWGNVFVSKDLLKIYFSSCIQYVNDSVNILRLMSSIPVASEVIRLSDFQIYFSVISSNWKPNSSDRQLSRERPPYLVETNPKLLEAMICKHSREKQVSTFLLKETYMKLWRLLWFGIIIHGAVLH